MVQLARRYTRAANSDNLKNDGDHFDADVLAAMALASPLGSLLFRVKYLNDASLYQKLLHQWTWIVSTKALNGRWPQHVGIDKVASLSLNRWLNSVCPVCTGRQRQTLFNKPILSDQKCRVCNGTGEAPLHCNPALRNYVFDMVQELHAITRKAGTRAKKKLGEETAAAA